MIQSAEVILLVVSTILMLSIFVGKAGYKFGLPALLLFLGVGMLFGSDGLGIQFDNPQMTQFIGTLALSIILFSGGMDTKVSEVRPIASQGIVLATLGVLIMTFYRRIHLSFVPLQQSVRYIDLSGSIVIGCCNGINRFGFGLFHIAEQRSPVERKLTSDIGVGKR